MADTPTPELLQALNSFQQTTISAFKDSKGYGYKYASEESINDTIRPAKALGLVHYFTCLPTGSEFDGKPGKTDVTLVVRHITGGELTSTLTVDDYDPNNKKDARHQQRGSGISYAKRYLLAAMFGLATSENEGETIFPPAKQEAEEPAPKGAKPKANSNAPTQSQSSAKPAVDPLEARRAKCSAVLNAAYKADKGILPIWRQHMKHRFDGAFNLADWENKLGVVHLTTAEMLDECEAWIAKYQKAAKA